MSGENGASTANGSFHFLTGLLIGAGAALLWAPCSGEETRQRLRSYAQDTKNRVNRFAEKAGTETNKALEKGQEFVHEKVSLAKDNLRNMRESQQGEHNQPPMEKRRSI